MQTISLVADADLVPLTDMIGPLTYGGPSARTVRSVASTAPPRTSYVPERPSPAAPELAAVAA